MRGTTFLAVVGTVSSLVMTVPAAGAPPLTERVSVASDGTQANGDSTSWYLSLSSDGRFVAFSSRASNLMSGDTNGSEDVFVRDRVAGVTERVSVASDGAEANSYSSAFPSISSDGRLVAFESVASNLVPGDTNGRGDVFVRSFWPPSVPTGLGAVADPTGSRIDLTWVDASPDEAGFEVARQADGADWETVGSTAADGADWADTAVVLGIAYAYRVRSVNGNGPSAWSETAVVVLPDIPPAARFRPVVPVRRLAHGQTLVVPVSGVGAVSLNVTVTEPVGAGFVTVYGCGVRPWASNVNSVAGQTVPNAVLTPVGGDGSFCVYTSMSTHVVLDLNGWFPGTSA